jgi:hypothetical protein
MQRPPRASNRGPKGHNRLAFPCWFNPSWTVTASAAMTVSRAGQEQTGADGPPGKNVHQSLPEPQTLSALVRMGQESLSQIATTPAVSERTPVPSRKYSRIQPPGQLTWTEADRRPFTVAGRQRAVLRHLRPRRTTCPTRRQTHCPPTAAMKTMRRIVLVINGQSHTRVGFP